MNIELIYNITVRRNLIIADLFHRMKYMEKRDSGLKKILSETMKMVGYTDEFKPIFSSTISSFTVILKNMFKTPFSIGRSYNDYS